MAGFGRISCVLRATAMQWKLVFYLTVIMAGIAFAEQKHVVLFAPQLFVWSLKKRATCRRIEKKVVTTICRLRLWITMSLMVVVQRYLSYEIMKQHVVSVGSNACLIKMMKFGRSLAHRLDGKVETIPIQLQIFIFSKSNNIHFSLSQISIQKDFEFELESF